MSQGNVEIMRRGMEQYLATGEPPWELLDEQGAGPESPRAGEIGRCPGRT